MLRNPPSVGSVEANNIFGLLPGFAGADTAAKGIGQAKEEVRGSISCAGGSTTDGVAGEPAIKVQITKLAIIAGIEGLDDLMIELAAEFKCVPTVGPGNGVFRLPNVVIEVLGCSPLTRCC